MITFAAGILLPMTIFIAAPLSFVAFNLNEYPPSGLLIQSLIALLIAASVVIWLAGKYEMEGRAWQFLLKLYYGASILTFIFYTIPKPFSGDFSKYDLFILVDLEIMIAIAVFCYFSSLKLIKNALAVVVLLLSFDMISSVINLYTNLNTGEKILDVKSETKNIDEASWKDHPGNVYFILMDAFPGDALPTLKKNIPNNDLDGFTYFADFTTNSWSTKKSLPVFFSGDRYDGKRRIGDWEKESFSSEGFVKLLTQIGVKWNSYDLNKYKKTQAEKTTDSGVVDDDIVIIDFSFLKLLPYSLFIYLHENHPTSELNLTQWSYGFSIISKFSDKIITSKFSDNTNLTKPMAVWSVELFEEMVKNEENLPSRGQFIFLHSMVTHAPYILDKNCQLRESNNASLSNVTSEHLSCGTKLISRFINRLKALGHFEDALIMFASDHGALHLKPHQFMNIFGKDMVRVPADTAEEMKAAERSLVNVRSFESLDMENLPSAMVDRGVSALLLVKPPHGKGFTTVNSPRSQLQFAPTILEHYGIENSLNNSRSVFNNQPFPIEESLVQLSAHSGIAQYKNEDIFQYSRNNAERKWRFIGTLKAQGDGVVAETVKTTSREPKVYKFKKRVSRSSGKYKIDRAFDGLTTPDSFWEVEGPFPIELEVISSSSSELLAYEFNSGPKGIRMPKAWQVYGLNRDGKWVLIDDRKLTNPWKENAMRKFSIVRPDIFTSYRLILLEGFDPAILRIHEIKLIF